MLFQQGKLYRQKAISTPANSAPRQSIKGQCQNYIQQKTIDMAKDMLVRHDKSISEIAYSLGSSIHNISAELSRELWAALQKITEANLS